MKLKNYKDRISQIPSETRDLVKFNMDVLERIHELLEKKFDGKQKLLAQKMNKSEAEISKLLSGYHNYTFKTIIKLQNALGEQILAVCTDGVDNSTFVQAKAPHGYETVTMNVSECGDLEEVTNGFVAANKSNVTHKPTTGVS